MIARKALRAKLWTARKVKTVAVNGQPYLPYIIKKINQFRSEKLQQQVLYHSEACCSATRVPLAHWVRLAKQQAFQMGQSQTLAITWNDWKQVLGPDRTKWIAYLLDPVLCYKERKSKLGNFRLKSNPKAVWPAVRDDLFIPRTSGVSLTNADFGLS